MGSPRYDIKVTFAVLKKLHYYQGDYIAVEEFTPLVLQNIGIRPEEGRHSIVGKVKKLTNTRINRE
ncbi:hypothetical protein BEP19_14790 [Ammoniphilus oxalaticus]|uniref:Uncharacterized protein n=1 Tax=Ammoniphilus oxalaticus TaxID=66863 RepID=A0A419SEQ4_9BACL|nr:hypothetical protein BEP19_14790 [Ammoniphilus oxalaticus]